jgi:hypothetical protein
MRKYYARTIPVIGSIIAAITLSACSSNTEIPPQKLKIDAQYFSVINDTLPSLSSRLTSETELSQKISDSDTYHYVLLGQDVASICKQSDCRQSSNLARLNYVVAQGEDNLLILGKMTNETGASTISSGPAGWIKKSINDGVKLHSEGTVVQEFTLPIVMGESVVITGPLGDKLVVSVVQDND